MPRAAGGAGPVAPALLPRSSSGNVGAEPAERLDPLMPRYVEWIWSNSRLAAKKPLDLPGHPPHDHGRLLFLDEGLPSCHPVCICINLGYGVFLFLPTSPILHQHPCQPNKRNGIANNEEHNEQMHRHRDRRWRLPRPERSDPMQFPRW